jgi:hypothetical protein
MAARTPQDTGDDALPIGQEAQSLGNDESLMGYESALPWLQLPPQSAGPITPPCLDNDAG